MRLEKIEAWALELVEQVEQARRLEDDRVELKRDWPEPRAAARRIAGHANAVGAESILWLIGVGDDGSVLDCGGRDPADWWQQVEAEFDEVAPEPSFVSVQHEGGRFVAVLIRTDRAPFVVKTRVGGTPEREVPWRSATRIRSARRSDLIRMLVPRAELPVFETIEADLELEPPQPGTNNWVSTWKLSIKAYATIAQHVSLTIANHLCRAGLQGERSDMDIELPSLDVVPWGYRFEYRRKPPSLRLVEIPERINTAVLGVGQITLNGPAGIILRAHASLPLTALDRADSGDEPDGRDTEVTREEAVEAQEDLLEQLGLLSASKSIEARFQIGVVGADRRVRLAIPLEPEGWTDGGGFRWVAPTPSHMFDDGVW